MANWYVDSAATGTGSADTPANSALNITSLTSTFSCNQYGTDTIWVRRNWQQDPTDSRSANWGMLDINSVNVNSHGILNIVGWPNSGDPFYDVRPQAAIDAGWDADTSRSFLWPTIVVSGLLSSLRLQRANTFITNFTVCDSGGSSKTGIGAIFPGSGPQRTGWIGVGYVGANAAQTVSNGFEHIVVCGSWGNSTSKPFHTFNSKKITITASCVKAGTSAGTGLLGVLDSMRIEEIVNLSNSIDYLFGDAANSVVSVGRLRGVRPNVDIYNRGVGVATFGNLSIDDCYGDGPAVFGAPGAGIDRIVSSGGVAVFSGQTAWRTSPKSYNLNQGKGPFLGPMVNGAACVRQIMDVTSGVPLVLRVHIAAALMNNQGIEKHGGGEFFVPADGCGHKLATVANSGIQVGSPGLWTGSLTAVESYYMMYARYVPSETARVNALANIPHCPNYSSGANLYYSPYIEVGST